MNEKNSFQRGVILNHLQNIGYRFRNEKTDYDQHRNFDVGLLIEFLKSTQTNNFNKVLQIFLGNTDRLIDEIENIILRDGLITILKMGLTIQNINFKLMYELPNTSINKDEKYQEAFSKNIFSVMEEVPCINPSLASKKGRIDIVTFINGFPFATMELKSNLNGQNSFDDAVNQYRSDRDSNEKIFRYSLANFAVDQEEIWLAPKMNGKNTIFRSFNKGLPNGAGRGNPVVENGFKTEYLWKEIFSKEIISKIIGSLVQEGIFPQYHQYDVVTKIINDVKVNPYKHYLIKHSAGSGKTLSISWLTSNLISLNNDKGNPIYDTVVIITDRLVVDRQLQEKVLKIIRDNYNNQEGIVKVLDENTDSGDLKIALENGKRVVISTIQKFAYINRKNELLKGMQNKKFAIIIDEAHSSTSGKNMESVIDLLYGNTGNNISMFAFTATPKDTTMELFGTLGKDGKKEAFHVYSMKQAVEDGSILNPIKHYITYNTSFEIELSSDEDPIYETKTAKRKIKREIANSDENIKGKLNIFIKEFKNTLEANKGNELYTKGKAMIITSSREEALKYKFMFDKIIEEAKEPNMKALVAFTGELTFGDTVYTEVKVNKQDSEMSDITEANLPIKFKENDNYKFLIVAEKYQTGYDEQALVFMGVDAVLEDIRAVQTISRLNRIYEKILPHGKKEIRVVDFRNTFEDIQDYFAKYDLKTVFSGNTSVKDLDKIFERFQEYGVLDNAGIAKIYNDIVTQNYQQTTYDLSELAITLRSQHDLNGILYSMEKFVEVYSWLKIIKASVSSPNDYTKVNKVFTYILKYQPAQSLFYELPDDIMERIDIGNFEQHKIKEYVDQIMIKENNQNLRSTIGKMIERVEKRLSIIIKELTEENLFVTIKDKNNPIDEIVETFKLLSDKLMENDKTKTIVENKNLELKHLEIYFAKKFDEFFNKLKLNENKLFEKVIKLYPKDDFIKLLAEYIWNEKR
jgi:type I restriction enzyme, R subunit